MEQIKCSQKTKHLFTALLTFFQHIVQFRWGYYADTSDFVNHCTLVNICLLLAKHWFDDGIVLLTSVGVKTL